MNEDVNTPLESQEVEATTEEIVEESTVETEETTQEPGSKTESSLLLKSLQEEREKRRLLEEELNAIRSSEDLTDDEIRVELNRVKTQLHAITEDKALTDLQGKYPALKDKTEEFNEYRKDFPESKLDAAAKAFLAEKGLLQSVEPRKGLEKSSGGGRTAPSQGLSADDITDLRTNNFRKYRQMVTEGKIKI